LYSYALKTDLLDNMDVIVWAIFHIEGVEARTKEEISFMDPRIMVYLALSKTELIVETKGI